MTIVHDVDELLVDLEFHSTAETRTLNHDLVLPTGSQKATRPFPTDTSASCSAYSLGPGQAWGWGPVLRTSPRRGWRTNANYRDRTALIARVLFTVVQAKT